MILTFLLACAQSIPEPAAPLPLPENPDAKAHEESTLFGNVKGVKFATDWTSPACGGRGYARNIHFDADQHYAAIDLVSPCPVGTECSWSGMTGFQGLWDLQGKVLRVQEIGMASSALGGPHPVKFEATEDGKLVENGCFYTQGLTVPPGYTEDQVRPKVAT